MDKVRLLELLSENQRLWLEVARGGLKVAKAPGWTQKKLQRNADEYEKKYLDPVFASFKEITEFLRRH